MCPTPTPTSLIYFKTAFTKPTLLVPVGSIIPGRAFFVCKGRAVQYRQAISTKKYLKFSSNSFSDATCLCNNS